MGALQGRGNHSVRNRYCKRKWCDSTTDDSGRMSQEHQSSLDKITAAQLLPVSATIVAAGTGSTVAQVLPNIHHARGTIMVSYAMWGMSVPLAMSVLVIYYQRLAVHKLPPREVIVSSFLPLGPLGMGGYT